MSNNLTLGITKIGDLLLRSTITVSQDGKALEDVNLQIPEYQRPYKWTAKNVNQLLDDIIYAKNDNREMYRVGTLILHKENNTYNIVDGQQRVTTFSLLLKALDIGPVSFLNQELRDNSYNKFNISNNYRLLRRQVKDRGDRQELATYILDNCELIVVITEDISEAFQFFDSQNARGKKLYPHDLLKAYHLREMNHLEADETEKTVRIWEDMEQVALARLFSDYLYRLKEWVKGNRFFELNEHNLDLFKGVASRDNFPYAQFYKGAYAYAEEVNHSALPFVTGLGRLRPFQINTPIVAGKPFFEYAKYYFDILADVRNNDKYFGYFISDNAIIKVLDENYKSGVGNNIARFMLDSAILLYIDRFCPEIPSKADTEQLEQFVFYAFVWAYSLRAQYQNLGWQSAQNYILSTSLKELKNTFNLYKKVIESDSPSNLLSTLANLLVSIMPADVPDSKVREHAGDKNCYLSLFGDFWGGKKDA